MPKVTRLDNTITALNRSMLVNRSTGMGTMRDSFTETEIGYVPILGEQSLRSLHRGNWWIRRIIDVPAMDMVKGGVTITHPSNDAESVQKVLGLYESGGEKSPYSRKMGGAMAFQRAEMYARWFGRGYIVLRVNGNEKLEKPLTKVKSFEGFSVLDRYQLRPSNESINYEDPEFYQIARRYQRGSDLKGADFNQRIHETRVLVFDGAFIHPYDINLESADGAHDSVIQSLYECFCRHYSVQNAIAKGLDSYSLFKVAIANLGELMMQDEGEAALTKALDAIAEMISMHRILVQDSEAANSEFQERSFTGVAENAAGFRDELTAAAWPLPHYKIWGSVDKSALADSGGAETRAYADDIGSLQIAKFRDNHRRVFNALFEATAGTIPDGYGIDYPSIYKATPKEEAEIKEIAARTHAAYITAEVLEPLEVKLVLATNEDVSNVLDANKIESELERAKALTQKQLEVEEAELEQAAQAASGVPVEGVETATETEVEEEPAAQRTVNGQVVPDLDSAISLLDGADVLRVDKKKGGKKGKKRNCKKGLSCGNSCISRKKTCRKKPTAKQAGLAQQLRNEVVPFERPAGEATANEQPKISANDPSKDPSVGVNRSVLDEKRAKLVDSVGEELVLAAEAKLQKFVEEAELTIRVPTTSVLQKITDDRFKSQFETNTSKALKNKTARKATEEEAFGYGWSTKKEDRPIYGYLSGSKNLDPEVDGDLDGYGSIAVRLKSSVRERTTFTGDDSLATESRKIDKADVIPGSSVNNVNAASMLKESELGVLVDERETLEIIANASSFAEIRQVGGQYLEAQYHGQLRGSDIGEIVFTSEKQKPTPEVRAWAKKNGVTIREDYSRERDAKAAEDAEFKALGLDDLFG